MKKILALLMTATLIFSLTACKSNSEELSNSSVPTTITENSNFTAPDNYAVVLLASINPQIKLYLDDNGIVLAIEAANDDAEQIIDSIIYKDTDYQTVIKMFVLVANSKAFIKDDAKIDFEITDVKNQDIDTNAILNNASIAATNAANELNITLATNIIDSIDNTKSEEDKTTSEDDNTQSESQQTQTQSQNTTPSHTHAFSNATCTETAKCSCGATNGGALGHSWQSATCKASKTCKTCGVTEGEKGDHSYSGGKCTVCGISNTLNPKTDLNTTKEYVGNLSVSGDMLIGGALQFDGDACVVVDRYFNSVQTEQDQTPIVFEGKNYYSEGGGQNPHYFELTDTEIIVKGSFWGEDPDAVTIKLILLGDGTLKVTYSTNSLFPVDAIFSTDINDVLK